MIKKRYDKKPIRRRLSKRPFGSLYRVQTTSLPRSMPSFTIMDFHFSNAYAMSVGASVGMRQFRINSIWDPDYSVGTG